MGKHKHWSLKDTQSRLLRTDMPYLLVCWKCCHMGYLTPSSTTPLDFAPYAFFSPENDIKLPYSVLLSHFSILYLGRTLGPALSKPAWAVPAFATLGGVPCTHCSLRPARCAHEAPLSGEAERNGSSAVTCQQESLGASLAQPLTPAPLLLFNSCASQWETRIESNSCQRQPGRTG